jgi:hypothetical protein
MANKPARMDYHPTAMEPRAHFMKRIASLVAMALLLAGATTPPVAVAGEVTQIEAQEFRLSLPGQWTGSHEEASNSWTYHSADGRDTVTVEIFRRLGGLGLAEMRKDLNAFLSPRRAAEQQMFGSGAVVGLPEIKELPGGGLLARFLSSDAGHNRRGYTQIVVNKAVVGCFRYESTGLDAKEFSNLASSAFAQIGLAVK